MSSKKLLLELLKENRKKIERSREREKEITAEFEASMKRLSSLL